MAKMKRTIDSHNNNNIYNAGSLINIEPELSVDNITQTTIHENTTSRKDNEKESASNKNTNNKLIESPKRTNITCEENIEIYNEEPLPKKQRKTPKNSSKGTNPSSTTNKTPKKKPLGKKISSLEQISEFYNSGMKKLSSNYKELRSIRDLSSGVVKIERMYGFKNKKKLTEIGKFCDLFKNHIFTFPQDILVEKDYLARFDNSQDLQKIREIFEQKNANEYERQSMEQLQNNFDFNGNNKAQKIIFENNESEIDLLPSATQFSIPKDNYLDFPVFKFGTRNGLIYNTSYLITDLEWIPISGINATTQLLVVAKSAHASKQDDPKLKLFGTETHTSVLDVFQVEIADHVKIKKIQTIVHNLGEIWNMKCVNKLTETEENGDGIITKVKTVLLFCCQQGSINGIDIKCDLHLQQAHDEDSVGNNDVTILSLKNIPITIKLSRSPITCFDFINSTTIIAGFQSGHIAEFDLTDPELVPSYYHRIHESYITSIVVSYSDFENPIICTNSYDGCIVMLDPTCLFTSKEVVGKFRGANFAPMCYSPQLLCVIFTDGINSVKYVAPHAIFASHCLALHENSVSSLASSKLHPMILSGSADGAVYMHNLQRRIFSSAKLLNLGYKYIRLWDWKYNKELDTYRLDGNYHIKDFSAIDITKLKMEPPGINISCIKWNESLSGAKVYAFTNSAGLLVIEKLE
ncbi:uncharacterized protein SCODWIG_02320 [Saccharomycodes ludwigii]|uniref:Transcription factor tau 91 kDa subunit n=1 Tax=Saccharomycodes ludwigii TaxID=36035 RepID=A0A376B7L9_9ASCO|nr:hypothetical protein SCDLUD_003202 [Saccharomycodes ludwigii]KAH3900231.1 hypothetical protein SCDLUD_003202 [Saccharomycodes ludwigii]SSD60559.1 uncharacterized protein SCODWIG_02320 [Saccharomycodes ludwigii]